MKRSIYALLLSLLLSIVPAYPASDFDGSTSQVIVTSTAAIETVAITVGCWTRREGDGEGGVGQIMSKDDGGGTVAGWAIRQQSGVSEYSFTARIPNNGRWTIARPATNTWAHVAVTYDGSSDANDPVIYLDGVSQTITEILTPIGTWDPGTLSLSMGKIGSGAVGHWDGQLAECFYYDRILSANEIMSIACRGSLCGVRSVPRGLVGYWPLGVFSGRNYTSTSSLAGTPTGLTVLDNGPPIAYSSQGDPP